MKTIKTSTWLKIGCAAGAGVAALLAHGATTGDAIQTAGSDPITAQEIARKSRDAYASLSSYKDNGTVVSEMAGHKNQLTFNTRLQRPNLYRIDWAQGKAAWNLGMAFKGVVWSDGSGDYFLSTTNGQDEIATPQETQGMKQALALATGLSWASASSISGVFFNQDLGDLFTAPVASGRFPLQKENDAKIGDVDCYVVSNVRDLSKQPEQGKPGIASTMLWIGKRDFLIHQSRTKYVEKVDDRAAASDEAIDQASKKSLEIQHKPATPEAIAAMRPQMKAIMKQVQSTLKTGFESGVVTTQTRQNIVVNQMLAPADFIR